MDPTLTVIVAMTLIILMPLAVGVIEGVARIFF